MKKIIAEHERGLLFQNGRLVEYLMPGKHRRFGCNLSVRVLQIGTQVVATEEELNLWLKNPAFAQEVALLDVADETLALHFVNGRFEQTLPSGRYAFWKVYHQHTFQIVDIKTPEVSDEIPRYLFESIPQSLYYKVEVLEFQKVRLNFDGKLVRLLEPGTHYFWKNGTKISVGVVDLRARQMDITGQEILTRDKVALRINFVCNYKVTDCVKIHTEIEDYEKQIHVLVQLALREYVGKYRLDEILENKEQIGTEVLAQLKEQEADYFVTFAQAGVKDIILPGEVREIMNTVLIAEKRAQANVLTRREEVASTRSLLNTAKLMDENQTLYKLKELEYLEKICENVGSISVSGGTDLLSQLTRILKGD